VGSRLAFFEEAIRSAHRVALDTSACIYFLGSVAPHVGLVRRVVERAAERALELELSAIVQLELLVRPMRTQNQAEIDRVMMFTDRSPNLRLAPVDRGRLLLGARIRAHTNLGTPDSIIVASAAVGECDLVIGNDKQFKRIVNVDAGRDIFGSPYQLPAYIHLDDYIDAA
jgi:predicted nucleic acid-binding protein